MSYEYKEVVANIQGLNTVSTLKKWRKKAEDLAGVTLQEGITGVRGRYHALVPLFSEEDIEKFQQVANLKEELGLDNAILHAFANGREPPKPLNEQIVQLESFLDTLIDSLDRKFNQLEQEDRNLKSQIHILDLQVERLSKQLEALAKPKGLFRRKIEHRQAHRLWAKL